MRKMKTGIVSVVVAAFALHTAAMQAEDKKKSAAESFAAGADVAVTKGANESADAESIVEPISQRMAADAQETPEFRKHIVPLMGKLGCNGRACHGSFQGQGGFRLSLFGYDFKMDHDGLSERVDADDPAESYALHKATLQEPHRGGKRMDVGSWEYKVFLNWIKGGAKNVDESTPNLVRVDVEPKEIVFANKGETVQMRAVAVWSDGAQEDVTPLCRFQSNSEQIAEVNKTGLVTALEPGDSHIVVFYDNGVVPIPVMQPVSTKAGAQYPKPNTPTPIDELVVTKLRKLGIVQSATCTDAEFLRRVSLDITGSLPAPSEVESFLSDSSADKRGRKINELLERPSYTAWWTTKLCDFTGNSDDQLNNVGMNGSASRDWYDWVYDRVEKNLAYDQLVEGMVLATSRNNGESYQEYCKTMSDIYAKNSDRSFAEREYMPHYWSRRNFQDPNDRAIGFAYTFLGIRIQCAQCHKHPFDQWTQDDFKQFTGFFTGTQGRSQAPAPENRAAYNKMLAKLDVKDLKGNQLRRKLAEVARSGKLIPFGEVYAMAPPKPVKQSPKSKKKKKPQRGRRVAAEAKLLGSDKIDLTKQTDIRRPLMDWLRSRENKLFAKAFVNRVWANYFNVGIVEPPDDHSLANPPSNAALLDFLAEGFVANDYDMKWLHREICNSRTYQLSWQPNATNELDERNFSRAIPRRLPAEAAYDALVQATSSDERFAQLQQDIQGRAIGIPGGGQRARGVNGDLRYAMEIFGRSIRESNCDCDRSSESSLLQTVFLRNDNLTLAMIDDAKTGWLAQVAKSAGVEYRPQVTRSGNSDADRRRREAKLKGYRRQMKSLNTQLAAVRTQRETANTRLAKFEKDGNKNGIKSVEKYMKSIEAREKKVKASLRKIRERIAQETGETIVDADGNKTEPQKPQIDAEAIVRQAYLRTLSRPPSNDELESSLAFLDQSKDSINGVRGLLWALVNTKEFIVNH